MHTITTLFTSIMLFFTGLFSSTPVAPPVSNIQMEQSVVAATSTIDQSNETGVILLGDASKYENLSPEQKGILESYYKAFKKRVNDEAVKAGVDPAVYANESPVEGCRLKYYDSKKILVGCAIPKPTFPLSLMERGTWKSLSKTCEINLNSGYIETSKYLISVSDSGICYYKTDNENTTFVQDSDLVTSSKKETYIKVGGMIDYYDISFDEQTKILTAGIFKRSNSETNIKSRTVQFTLK